jgi:predicted nucleotidyltransferase
MINKFHTGSGTPLKNRIAAIISSSDLSKVLRSGIFVSQQLSSLSLSKFGVVNVGLFGSYLRNEQSINSDIDLLIEFESGKENFDNYMAVYEIFETLFQNQKVEVVTKNGLSKYIGPEILKDVMYV